MTFSFVIPAYNHYALLHQLLFDIYQRCSLVDEVIVVDDCSTDSDVADGMKWWKESKLLPIQHLRLNENVMFLKASNIGLKKATGDVVCLISTDVRIHKNIVASIHQTIDYQKSSLVGGRFLDWDTTWNSFPIDKGKEIVNYLEGWLLATTKIGWEELGYFDERYVPSDYEDVDLSKTATTLGYNLVSLPSDMTHHIGGQSIRYNSAREEITKRNRVKFAEKWGFRL